MIIRILLALFARRSEVSTVVRQNVKVQLESWRDDWSHKVSVVILKVFWNLAFAAISVAALLWFAREEADRRLAFSALYSFKWEGYNRRLAFPALFSFTWDAKWRLAFAAMIAFDWEDATCRVRAWILGYSLQRVLNVVLLLLKYYKKRKRIISSMTSSIDICSSSENKEDYVTSNRCQAVTKVFLYLWWIFGVFCLKSSYTTPGNATFLLWLTLAFLAMDVSFAVLRFLVVSLVEVACCLCLPCVINILYYISSQGSASEAEINDLIEHRFEMPNADVEQPDGRTCKIIPMRTNGSDFSTERVLQAEDTECCVCLSGFEDGGQLLLLPCNHLFHSACIVKWLRLKASCPICTLLVSPIEQV